MKEEMQLRSDFENRKLELIALTEAEVFKNYNRRENIKIQDLPESHQSGKRESNQQTAAVIDLVRRLNVSVTENSNSIAHRLPASTRTQNRPVIVKFSQPMAKNKKNHSDVRIFEDKTKAMLNFLRMMKSDVRVISAWTREGTIFYETRLDGLIYKISNLYQGGIDLKYGLRDVLECFRKLSNQFNSFQETGHVSGPFENDNDGS